MGRRGKGEGSVYQRKRDKRWMVQVMDPLSGKRKYYCATPNRRAVALAKLEEVRQRLKHGQMLPDERLTMREYLEEWLDKAQARHHLKDSSLKRYREALSKHVIPALGRELLTRLSVKELRDFYEQKQTELAPASLHTVHAVLRTALQDALIDELVYRNVADVAKPAPAKRKTRPTFTPKEADKLLEKARGDRWEALYWLALNTAMRESELLSLRWSDVDLEQHVLTIREAKTDAGIRSPGLISQVVEKLQEHKVRLIQERLKAGPLWKDQGPFEQGLVFPNTIGRRQHCADFLEKHFYPLLTRAGLRERDGKPVHFHDLRHTAISWLLSLGIPAVDVAQYVGHADATVTLRVYAHSFPDSQQALVETMERARSGGK